MFEVFRSPEHPKEWDVLEPELWDLIEAEPNRYQFEKKNPTKEEMKSGQWYDTQKYKAARSEFDSKYGERKKYLEKRLNAVYPEKIAFNFRPLFRAGVFSAPEENKIKDPLAKPLNKYFMSEGLDTPEKVQNMIKEYREVRKDPATENSEMVYHADQLIHDIEEAANGTGIVRLVWR